METDVIAKATIELAAKDLEYGEIEFIVSKTVVDRYDETIDVKGIDFGFYEQNPVVLWAHNYEALPLGKATRLWRKGDELRARVKFAVDILPFADTVYKLIKAGVINAVSIGGKVTSWSEDYMTILKMDMYEFSVVPVPANPTALVTAKSIEGLQAETVAKEYNEYMRQLTQPSIHETLEDHATILKNLQSSLDTVIKNTSKPAVDLSKQKQSLSQSRGIVKNMKVQIDEFLSDLNKELKGLHNGRNN